MLASIQIWGLKKKRLESSGLRCNLFWGYFHFEGSASKERLADLGSSNRNHFIVLPAMPGAATLLQVKGLVKPQSPGELQVEK